MPVDQPATQPPAVVITAARLPPAAGDPAFSILRVSPTVLKVSERLDDALTAAPGFSLYRRTSSLGANPTTQGVSLRGIAGSGASRALVTLDGVPQNDPFGGWVIWSGLPPESISGATVVRGAGAGPYGAGALTGVVALEQPDHVDGHIAGEISGGEYGYGRAAAIAEIDSGPVRAFLDASGETDAGWVPVRQGRGSVDQPLSLKDWSAAERVEVDIGRAVLSERIAGYEEDRGAGTLYAASRERGEQASLTLVAPPTDAELGWRVQGWIDGSNLANTSASVAAGRNSATLSNNQYSTPATGVGFNAALRRSRPTYSWEVGVDLRDFQGESNELLYSQGVFSGTRVSGGGELVAGVYAEGSHSIGKWLLTAGVRVDDWEDYSSLLVQTGSTTINQHPADRGGVVPSGRIGLRRDISDAVYVRAAAYSGFRQATLNELHRPFRVGNDVTEANPNLTPEQLYGVEFGIGGQRVLTWDGDVFYNQLSNAITNVTIGHGPGSFPLAGFVPAGGTLYERENAGTVDAYGFEGEADKQITSNLDLRAAFSWTHARVDGGSISPQLTGKRPAETPDLTVTTDLSWRVLGKLILTGELRYEGDRFDDDLNTRKIDGGTGVNARAEWLVGKGFSAYVAADNIFNAALETGRSAANIVTYDAPRMVRVGLTLRR